MGDDQVAREDLDHEIVERADSSDSQALSLEVPIIRRSFLSYLTFNPEKLSKRFSVLGVKWDERYTKLLNYHEYDMYVGKVLFAGGRLLMIGLSASIYVGAFADLARKYQWSSEQALLPAAVAALLFFIGLFIASILLRPLAFFVGTKWRILDRITAVLKSNSGNVVDISNQLGWIARLAFVQLQGGRQTWASPPAVADRALRLTKPLLDIDLQDPLSDKQREVIRSFLYDVAALVVIGRPELIRPLLDRYDSLPRRPVESENENREERDALYLDPMRGRSRWDIVREYVLPLAAWVSLAVSMASLAVAILALTRR